jgi:hypothetical protein
MRTVTLTKLAAQAEILVLRRQATAVARRAAYAAVAAAFGLGVLVLLHVAGYLALLQFARMPPFYASLILLAADLVFLLIFALMANGTMSDPILAEAMLVRDQSLEQVRESLTVAALIRPAGRLLGRKHMYGVVLAALTAQFLGGGKQR